MKIQFLTTAHNSLSQRLEIELTTRGHKIIVTRAVSADVMVTEVALHQPQLIIAPMLKIAIPEAICMNFLCLIVHPGIKGDRGPSSLDWAILTGERAWGVTVLQADSEMDTGPIWATHNFPLPNQPPTKSGLYRQDITEAAVRGVLEAVTKFELGGFVPEPLNYQRPDVRGQLRPFMRQSDRIIDWRLDPTDTMVRKIRAADRAPGVLDVLHGEEYFVYGAHPEDHLKGEPGELLAQRHGAICRATTDGAIWITHLKARGSGPNAGIKLPAAQALGPTAAQLPHSELALDEEIQGRTYQEIHYVERGDVGTLSFDFYNGAMSTEQCTRLRDAFLFACRRPTRVIVLNGGRDFFSNGIHLNVIEAAAEPAHESWRNIHAMNDLIHEILATMSHLVIAAFRGNAGAGGVMLGLAADYVFARDGVVLNPHYKSMGGLYGSEYWTHTLPRRVGEAKAQEITEACRPMGVMEAKAIGLIDESFGADIFDFEPILEGRARDLAQDTGFWSLIHKKRERRIIDESIKPLAHYRVEELQRMHVNFYGPDPSYHMARRNFVFKGRSPALEKSLLEANLA